jgi:hypothetical protein
MLSLGFISVVLQEECGGHYNLRASNEL